MHVARLAGQGRVDVRVSIHPNYASVRPVAEDTRQASQRNRVVPPQGEGEVPLTKLLVNNVL